ncbi:efflux RND transporter periplasmic adaptor subunit [Rubripirellula tenax]|nr:efflux RND transporter periplasmic adaptor subunit [Rubripirellula tenax]
MNQTLPTSTWASRLRTFLGSILLLVVVIAVIAAIAWTKARQVETAMSAPPPPEMPVAVRLFDPKPVQFRQDTVVVGTVLADKSVRLRNELTGVVTEVAIKPGQTVRAGDVLIRLDDRTERAELKAAGAALKLARSEMERAQRLSLANANSAQEVDATIAETTRAEAETERLKSLIDRKMIVARFDARVGLFDLNIGQYLVEGSEITTLEGIADFLNVDFAMPAHVADAISVGDQVAMQIDESSPVMQAIITAIDSRADPVSRSTKARAKLVSPPPSLLPGDSVRVTIQYGPLREALSVPATAVRRGPTGTMVYVAEMTPAKEPAGEPSMRAAARFVEIAGGGGTMNRVISGLTIGERVVADGSFKVIPGALLLPTSEQPMETSP